MISSYVMESTELIASAEPLTRQTSAGFVLLTDGPEVCVVVEMCAYGTEVHSLE